jgi:hypothetical protein
MWCLIAINREYLRTHPQVPPLYESGVRFIREQEGTETWEDIGQILQRGGGDCDRLCAWRVAELLERGVSARPAWRHRKVKSSETGQVYTLYHILVFIPGRGFEDPSAKLGMGWRE